LDIWQSINNRWIGILLGGIIGLILITIFSSYFNLSNEIINYFKAINIITLMVIFCIIYYIVFKLAKDSKLLKRSHLIIINSLIGAIFGLIVGFMSYESEIYWFIFGFLILSLIPVVNMLIVVFWLGSTIYISFFPDIIIPIFNDFLPIKLIDGSMTDITSLPLFIFPILVFLGYLITISVNKFYEKKRLMLNKITEQNELKNEMNKYESKLKKWKIEKYDTKILEEKQKNKTLNIKIQNLKDYESKIQKLKQFEKELKQLDIKDFDYDIITIKKKFKNPYKVNEIESDIIALKRRIKLRIEKLVEKTDKEIKNAYRIATKAEDLQRLNTLNILQENFLDYSKDLGFIDYSYKDAIDKIKDLYNQTVTLNVKPKKKSTTSIKKPIQKQNYYEILNIKQNATQNQIKKMFRRLSLAYHPDKKEDTGVDGDQKFRMVVEAYEILKDPIKRKKYDEEIGIKK
jgi:hypothetical protein